MSRYVINIIASRELDLKIATNVIENIIFEERSHLIVLIKLQSISFPTVGKNRKKCSGQVLSAMTFKRLELTNCYQ